MDGYLKPRTSIFFLLKQTQSVRAIRGVGVLGCDVTVHRRRETTFDGQVDCGLLRDPGLCWPPGGVRPRVLSLQDKELKSQQKTDRLPELCASPWGMVPLLGAWSI